MTNYAEHATVPARDYDKPDKVSNTPWQTEGIAGSQPRVLHPLPHVGSWVYRGTAERARVVVDAQLQGAQLLSALDLLRPSLVLFPSPWRWLSSPPQLRPRLACDWRPRPPLRVLRGLCRRALL